MEDKVSPRITLQQFRRTPPCRHLPCQAHATQRWWAVRRVGPRVRAARGPTRPPRRPSASQDALVFAVETLRSCPTPASQPTQRLSCPTTQDSRETKNQACTRSTCLELVPLFLCSEHARTSLRWWRTPVLPASTGSTAGRGALLRVTTPIGTRTRANGTTTMVLRNQALKNGARR